MRHVLAKHKHTSWAMKTSNRRHLYSGWFTVTWPLRAKSCEMDCWWSDCLCVLLTLALKYQNTPFLCRIAYPLFFFSLSLSLSLSLPSPVSLGRKHGCFFFVCFFSRALPLFTWLFVLGCHIISLSVDVASPRAHNEEVLVARGLVSLHRGYHRMLGHAVVRVWT